MRNWRSFLALLLVTSSLQAMDMDEDFYNKVAETLDTHQSNVQEVERLRKKLSEMVRRRNNAQEAVLYGIRNFIAIEDIRNLFNAWDDLNVHNENIKKIRQKCGKILQIPNHLEIECFKEGESSSCTVIFQVLNDKINDSTEDELYNLSLKKQQRPLKNSPALIAAAMECARKNNTTAATCFRSQIAALREYL